jgi:hypothetical protein
VASPNATFTEMVTTTLRNHPAEIADNVSKNNAFYRRLQSKGQIKKLDGGYQIVRPLDYQDNSTFQRYSGFDTLNINASDVLTSAQYEWVQSAINVVASGRELRMNSGREQIISLASARTKNAMRTAANYMSIDLYSSGALANQMGGLAAIITTDGTGTVGGINSGTYSFWANQFLELSGTNTWSKSNIKGEMNKLWLSTVRGNDKPDLVIFSHDFYSAYWESLQDNQRWTNNDNASSATAGFASLKYVTADVIFDSNTNFSTTAERGYFINSDYLELVSHRDANWTTMDEKASVNQDGVVIPVLWMGQLVCSNRARQGIMIDAG